MGSVTGDGIRRRVSALQSLVSVLTHAVIKFLCASDEGIQTARGPAPGTEQNTTVQKAYTKLDCMFSIGLD